MLRLVAQDDNEREDVSDEALLECAKLELLRWRWVAEHLELIRDKGINHCHDFLELHVPVLVHHGR